MVRLNKEAEARETAKRRQKEIQVQANASKRPCSPPAAAAAVTARLVPAAGRRPPLESGIWDHDLGDGTAVVTCPTHRLLKRRFVRALSAAILQLRSKSMGRSMGGGGGGGGFSMGPGGGMAKQEVSD